MASPAPRSRRLIAREDELDALASARRAAAQGHGALVLIEGEAGIGKTRLLAAFRETLAGGRAAVAAGRCREFGNLPYGPVREAFRSLGAAEPGPARDRTEYLAELQDAFAAAAARRFAVLLFEDVQWADDGTLRFLAHLLPALPRMRALAIATYRTEQRGDSIAAPYLARFAADPACRRLALGPLAARDVRRLVENAGAGAPDDAAEIERIVERSEGNPFFAEELLKDALERRTRERRTLPFTIRGLIDERMRALNERERRVVSLAAVIGRSFDAALLARIANAREERVLRSLRRARDAHLIEETDSRRGTFAFHHGLTREAVYDGMLGAETRALHGRILDTLAAAPDARVEDLGYHAWAAGRNAECVRYNERAGDAADALHAYADAVRAYERALSGAHGDADAMRLLAKSAAACARDGNAPRATTLYEEAAEAARRCGQDAEALEHYRLMSWQARIGGDSAEAMAILQRTMRLFPKQKSELRAQLALTLAFLHLDRGDTASAGEMLRETAPAGESPSLHNAQMYAALVRGDPDGVRRSAARYVAACAARGTDAASGRFNEPFGLVVLGYDDEALAKLDALLPELRDRRLRSLEVLAHANAAIVLARRGRLHEARERIELGLSIPEPATTGPVALASAALDVGRALDDERLIERSVTPSIVDAAFASGINSTLGRFAGPYARRLAVRGDDDGARAVLRRAMELLAAPFAATGTILAAVGMGDPWTRRRALDFLPALDAMSHVPLYAASAAHARALASRIAGDPDARTHARAAADRYAALGWPLLEAEALELAGERAAAAERYAAAGAAGDARRLRPARTGAPAALSARERQIAEMIVRGTPNALLAEQFAVNRRTIEKHLTSIYEKLGVRNRSELAALVARSQLL
ncbi:MAG TPA: AAA family ATPase [Candidatus Baltobacteraceae bacterium]|nr:AAA family ATPase [Candidatus Baltobacteraceae bacterium]